MATRNSSYWNKRFSTLENSLHREGMSCYAEIEQQYRRAEYEIENKMRSWYQRFANNNKVSISDARRLLHGDELAEFKWTVQDYIKAGEENALSGRWMKELENASAKYHISRLESLELELQQSLEVMFGNQLDSLDAAMRKVYTDGYYHTAFEIQKGWGVGWDFAQLDERKINKVIRKPWAADGRDFSERIWENRQKLVNELNQTLVQNMALGEDPQKAINTIAQKMEVSKRNAGRLVMTEEAYFASVSQADCFRELDVEQYQIIVTFDKETCDTCGDMDGRVFKMSEREVGATAPPFHPNCRCTTIPYFDEWYGLERERAARDENGQTYQVPADTTYKQWRGNLEVSHETPAETSSTAEAPAIRAEAEKMSVDNFPEAFKSKSEISNTQELVDYVNNLDGANPDTVELYNQMGKKYNLGDADFSISHAKDHRLETSRNAYTNEVLDAKLVIPKLDGDNLSGQVTTTLHEEMHFLDFLSRSTGSEYSTYTLENKTLSKAIESAKSFGSKTKSLFDEYQKAFKDLYQTKMSEVQTTCNNLMEQFRDRKISAKEAKKQISKLESDANKALDYESRNLMGGGVDALEDIYDAISGGTYQDSGTLISGHGSKYYSNSSMKSSEILANYGALSVTRPDLIELLREDNPDLVAALEETVKGMLNK